MRHIHDTPKFEKDIGTRCKASAPHQLKVQEKGLGEKVSAHTAGLPQNGTPSIECCSQTEKNTYCLIMVAGDRGRDRLSNAAKMSSIGLRRPEKHHKGRRKKAQK